jgi:hypothetical protein
VQVVHGLQLCGVSAPGCSMNLLGGAINLFVGAWLITSPVEGLAGLTILIAAWSAATPPLLLRKFYLAGSLRLSVTSSGSSCKHSPESKLEVRVANLRHSSRQGEGHPVSLSCALFVFPEQSVISVSLPLD